MIPHLKHGNLLPSGFESSSVEPRWLLRVTQRLAHHSRGILMCTSICMIICMCVSITTCCGPHMKRDVKAGNEKKGSCEWIFSHSLLSLPCVIVHLSLSFSVCVPGVAWQTWMNMRRWEDGAVQKSSPKHLMGHEQEKESREKVTSWSKEPLCLRF